MPRRKRYRCRNCGEKFEIDVLTADESRDRQRNNVPVSAVSCPKCRHQDLQEGWY